MIRLAFLHLHPTKIVNSHRQLRKLGYDFTDRYPLISTAARDLPADSFLLDGEAVACGDDGVPAFELIHHRRHDAAVFLYAFDLIAFNGADLRAAPIEARKVSLASLIRRAGAGLKLAEHLVRDDGPLVFEHACKLGCEGIVSGSSRTKSVSVRAAYKFPIGLCPTCSA